MNLEKTLLRGKLAERKQRLQELRIKADGLIVSLRLILDPYADLLELENLEAGLGQMEELVELWREAVKLSEEIKKMEKDL